MKALGLFLAFILLMSGGALYALAQMQAVHRITNVASIKTLGVVLYWDQAQTQVVGSIAWGILEPSESKTVQMYVVNTGNVPVMLWILTGNWTPPEAGSYMDLSWNYTGDPVAPGLLTPLALTLSVWPNCTGIIDFDFETAIGGTG